eukprot:CAMPEP_0198275812 /NCGR_PEP_ID=MMETSP1447-20131203/64976_1 /TAXON_ID=420782 /ORGANISM="Chaetoceros dichaeta, Strain CCMP1751" /LENGTH=576 /DNA_ID=CAMNT_0043970713 /DNA_START=67 /DNA_END=1794 /DNA_ORIENTATION=-
MRVLPGILACLAITDLLSNTAAHPDQHFHHHNGDDEESRELALGRCRTAEPTDEEIAESKRVMAKYAKQGLPRVKNIAIPTYFHEITDGQIGSLTDAEIDASIAVLNDTFGTEFTFNLEGKTVNDNAFWYTNKDSETDLKTTLKVGGCETLNIYSTYTNKDSETDLKTTLKVGGCETLNIYSTSGHGYLGYATFPIFCSSSSILDGVVIASTSKPGGDAPYDQGKTLTHEVGHWLGLYHTFQNGCSFPGDQIDDTPAHAAPDFECIFGDTCPSLPGANPIENFMNYTPDACMIEFTPNQITKMDAMWTEYRNTGPPSPPTPPSPVTSPVISPVTSPSIPPVTSPCGCVSNPVASPPTLTPIRPTLAPITPTPAPIRPTPAPVASPTTNCVGSEEELRVEVTTDDYPLETGWNITDGNEIIMEVEPLFYKLQRTEYKKYVCLSAPPDCLIFTMIDSYGDGIYGSDNFKVYSAEELKYSSGDDFTSLFSKTVNVIDNGCVSNPVASPPTLTPIRPTLAPITPTPAPITPTAAPIRPTSQPTPDNCPDGTSMFRADVFTDNNGDKIKIVVKKKNKNNKW